MRENKEYISRDCKHPITFLIKIKRTEFLQPFVNRTSRILNPVSVVKLPARVVLELIGMRSEIIPLGLDDRRA